MRLADGEKIKKALKGEISLEENFEDLEYNIEETQTKIIIDSLSEGASIQQASEIAGAPVGAALKQVLEQNNYEVTDSQASDLAQSKIPNHNFLTPEATPGFSTTRAKAHGNIIHQFLKEWKNPEEMIEDSTEHEQNKNYLPTIFESEVREVLEEAGISTYNSGEEPKPVETADLDDIDGKYILKDEIEKYLTFEDHIIAYLGETENTEDITQKINEIYGSDVVEEIEVSDYLIESDFAEFTSPKNFKLDRSKLEYEGQPEDIRKVLETYKEMRKTENT